MIEQALPILKDFKNIVLVEANDPVAFFAYPNKPSMLKPEGCEVHRMTVVGRKFGRGAGSAGRTRSAPSLPTSSRRSWSNLRSRPAR